MQIDHIRDTVERLEKLIKIPFSELYFVECLLLDLYDSGFKAGQSSRSDKDYEQGYRDGKNDKDED
jgi:hypothetical protein